MEEKEDGGGGNNRVEPGPSFLRLLSDDVRDV